MVVHDLGLSILRIPITEHLEFANDDDGIDHFNWDNFYLSDNNRRRGMAATMEFVKEFENRGVELFMASPWSPAVHGNQQGLHPGRIPPGGYV
jgi:hypothetical protein